MNKKKIKPHTECKDDKEFWSQYYKKPVTDEEAREIKENLIRLCKILIEIEKGKKKNDKIKQYVKPSLVSLAR